MPRVSSPTMVLNSSPRTSSSSSASAGMTHVKDVPLLPSEQRKARERFHRTIKADCIRPGTPFVDWTMRGESSAKFVQPLQRMFALHSALGLRDPRHETCWPRAMRCSFWRDAKLEAARQRRQATARQDRAPRSTIIAINRNATLRTAWPEDRALLGSNPSAESGPETKIEAALASPPSSSFLAPCEKPKRSENSGQLTVER